MAHLSLTWAWALVFTVSVLTVCCETDPDPWVYRVDVQHYVLKPSVFITAEQEGLGPSLPDDVETRTPFSIAKNEPTAIPS